MTIFGPVLAIGPRSQHKSRMSIYYKLVVGYGLQCIHLILIYTLVWMMMMDGVHHGSNINVSRGDSRRVLALALALEEGCDKTRVMN